MCMRQNERIHTVIKTFCLNYVVIVPIPGKEHKNIPSTISSNEEDKLSPLASVASYGAIEQYTMYAMLNKNERFVNVWCRRILTIVLIRLDWVTLANIAVGRAMGTYNR